METAPDLNLNQFPVRDTRMIVEWSAKGGFTGNWRAVLNTQYVPIVLEYHKPWVGRNWRAKIKHLIHTAGDRVQF